MNTNNTRIAVVGLGYVGLPLAVAFAKKYPTVGYDINRSRVAELSKAKDSTLEIEDAQLKAVLQKDIPTHLEADKGFFPTSDLMDIQQSNVFVVTVPTPVDAQKNPVLTPLEMSSKAVAKVLKKGDVVIYESTVYPGVTEEFCVPILESESGLKFNEDFFVGYSPERINPGDKAHTVEKILKVTSGSTPEIAQFVDSLYKSVIQAGTHLAPSIKVAEAAKVIENSQRDINIAFVNELAKIFNLLEIDTQAVLEAASTKWNFLPFQPGLVGGHCIGVDPYYLAQKAQQHGYHPEIILAGRRLNDSMGNYVAQQVVKALIKRNVTIRNAKVLQLGITFKENCPDIRNTRAIDVYHELKSYEMQVDVYDPWANADEVKSEFNLALAEDIQTQYDAVILTVAHSEFQERHWRDLLSENGIVYDVKGILEASQVDFKL